MTFDLTAEPATRPPAGTARAADDDLVTYWNDVLLQVFRQTGGAPGPLARTAAMLHGSIFDVVNHQNRADLALPTTRYHSYLGELPAVARADVEDAINVTARDLLTALHPGSTVTVAAAFAARYPAGADVDSPLGAAAAAAMLRLRDGDGSGADPEYTPRDVPGAWRPTTPGTSAATPHWGRVTPFSASSAVVFRPLPPEGHGTYRELLASAGYARQVAEVRALGAATSTERTTDQTEAAWFWAQDLDGTIKPPGHLLQLTAICAPPATLLDRARLFATLSFALADAAIAAWDSKFSAGLDLWRPESAIRLADTDGNDATEADPTWRPLSADRSGTPVSPPFPAYISGHATLAGAWAAVMAAQLGTDAFTFAATSDDPHLPGGATRTFTSFHQAAAENAISRIYLGVHYPFDAEVGLSVGTTVGRHVARTQFYRR